MVLWQNSSSSLQRLVTVQCVAVAIAIRGVCVCVCRSLLPHQVLLSITLISLKRLPAVPAGLSAFTHTSCLIVTGPLVSHIAQLVCSSITAETEGEIRCLHVKGDNPCLPVWTFSLCCTVFSFVPPLFVCH